MELESHTLLGSENDNFLSNQIFFHFKVRARLVMKDFFKVLVLLVEYIFLTTFYGLYFNHRYHFTLSVEPRFYTASFKS